jgi:GNAT superfamily N-acetyltransferase
MVAKPKPEATMNPNHQPPITVRIATFEDARKLAPMLSFIENGEITADNVRARMEATANTETPFIAEADGQPSGFAFLRIVPAISSEEPYAEITELYVEDLTQRESVSRAMAEKLESTALEKGAVYLHLLTGLRNNVAKNNYRLMGYRDYALALRKRLK